MNPHPELKSRIPHHGLFRRKALKELGGYFGGFRFGYDELITNLLLLTGTVSWTPEPLYWRRLRPDSLTRSPDTGLESDERRALRGEMREIYRLAYRDYQSHLSGEVSREEMLRSIRSRAWSRRGEFDSSQIRTFATKLHQGMVVQARGPHVT
jgi:hypothetical protein